MNTTCTTNNASEATFEATNDQTARINAALNLMDRIETLTKREYHLDASNIPVLEKIQMWKELRSELIETRRALLSYVTK